MFRVSIGNLIADPRTAVIASSQVTPTWMSDNLREPEHPGEPWKAATTAQQLIVIRLPVAQPVDVVALIDCVGFTSAVLQGHDEDTWTSAAWELAAAIAVNPWNRRRYHAWDLGLGDVTASYLRVVIPAASQPVSLGGLWVGTWTVAPRDIRWDYVVTAPEPVIDEQPEHGGWRVRSRPAPGRRTTKISATRQAVAGRPPALDDDLSAWRDVEAGMWEAGSFLAQIELDPAQCWVARLLSEPEWTVAGDYPEATLELEEVNA